MSFLNKLKDSSIKSKILILAISSVCIAVLCLYFLFAFNTFFDSREVLKNEMILLSNIIGERNVGALAFNDPTTISKSLKVVRVKPSVQMICIYTVKKQIIANYINYNLIKSEFQCPDNPKYGHIFNLNNFQNFQTINKGKNNLGYIFIQADISEINRKIKTSLLYISLVTLIILLVSYFLVKKTVTFISKPIKELTNIAQKVTNEDNYSLRVDKLYNDEIGILSDDFNKMIEKIEKRDKQIRDANKKLKEFNTNLEKKVKERTAELQEKTDTLKMAKLDLEHALKIKTDFLANMNHEIRTPIHNIRSFLDFLVKDWDKNSDDQRRILAERSYKSSERLKELIDKLLDLAKLSTQELEFTMNYNNFKECVESIILETESLREEKKLKLVFSYDKQATFAAKYDSRRITQVVSNLIGNAIKYSYNNTLITVDILKEEFQYDDGKKRESLVFKVKDQGVGIPEDELEHIFGRFNESSKTKSKAGGTGLGLAISKPIIKAHNGKIWAENNDKFGSTFTFVIPVEN